MRTLILYATKYGSTKKCAELLKTYLHGDVTVESIKSSRINPTSYDAIIIGGPVYMGKMNGSVTSFCKRNKRLLMSKRIALFACCYTPKEDTEYLKRLFPADLMAHSVCTTTVGGVMDYAKMNVAFRKLFESLKKIDDFNEKFAEPEIRTEDIKMIADTING
ncbi:flavodoxin domain-containing protein [Enterococcus sp. DIV0756]|uniref:flavodoxin domain-containing protein n=1 Tax=Enterococcus sp. DIV0756 TaxID=2774636 RepID=UPI003F21D576